MKKIKCNTFTVVGGFFRAKEDPDFAAKLRKLKKGDMIQLVRDPENSHDKNAIKCIAGDLFIGFIPAVLAQYFAPMMDNGVILSAVMFEQLLNFQVKVGLYYHKEED